MARADSGTQESCIEDATVLSWFRPIWSLHPVADDPCTGEHQKSRGLQQSVKEEEFGVGLAQY
jgi:hypothetical protein